MRVAIPMTMMALAATAGCSRQIPEEPAQLSGAWIFSYSMATDAGATCSGQMKFTISQTDQTFVGFQNGAATLACVNVSPAFGGLDADNNTVFANEMISGGVASRTEVAFAFDTLNGQSSGTVTNNQMSGASTWQIPVGPHRTEAMHGNWTAIKQ